MTDYFKVYLFRKDGTCFKQKAKDKETVKNILRHAQQIGYYKYDVIKRIKGGADIPVGFGYFTEEATVVLVDNIDTPYKIVCGNVVIDDRGRLIKDKAREELER